MSISHLRGNCHIENHTPYSNQRLKCLYWSNQERFIHRTKIVDVSGSVEEEIVDGDVDDDVEYDVDDDVEDDVADDGPEQVHL